MLITTPRLTVRPIALEDLEARHAYASDLENTRYMMFLPNEDIAETEAFIRKAMAEQEKDAPAYYECVALRDGVQVGGVCLYFLDRRDEAEIGWIFDKRYWGNGYALEAARAVMDWGRARWGIRRFIAQCDAENAASYRLMEKLGMRRVSCLPGRKNRSSDEERMEMTYEIVFD